MFVPLHDANPLVHIRAPYVTYALIALNAAIFLLSGGFDPLQVQRAAISFGLVPSIVNDLRELPPGYEVVPETLTYVTYAFLHADIWHLAGNMLFLWVFGDNVEDAVGHARFLAFYVICAAAGGWLHAFFAPGLDLPLIGASGATAGVVAAYLMLHPRVRLWVLAFGRIPLRLSAMWVLGIWVLYQLTNAVIALDQVVAWWAHVGGMAAGASLIVLWRRPDVPLFDRPTPAS